MSNSTQGGNPLTCCANKNTQSNGSRFLERLVQISRIVCYSTQSIGVIGNSDDMQQQIAVLLHRIAGLMAYVPDTWSYQPEFMLRMTELMVYLQSLIGWLF